jgi:glycosyltransferase involved in cell wall biosynthesis
MASGRLLVVSERYFPEGGGGELATHLIVGILRRRFEVTVVTGTARPEVHSEVQYVYEPALAGGSKLSLWLGSGRLAERDYFMRLVRESDVVYVPRFAYPVVPLAKRLGRRVVVHLHGYSPISYTAAVLAPYERRRLLRDDVSIECGKGVKHCAGVLAFWWLPRLARRWVAMADVVLCVSRRQAEIIGDAAPELREKIWVVYNPPPPIRVERRAAEVPTFLYAGGGDRLKGFYALVAAARRLGRRGIRARFVFVNEYSGEAARVLRALGRGIGSVELEVRGRVPRGELMRLLGGAWALVFPSLWEEPLPYVVVEAALAGVLPVASPVGGVPELLAGSPAEGFMGGPGDLAGRVEELAGMGPREVEELGRATRDVVSERLRGVEGGLAAVFS